jgi:phenylacetate-CoA ligase
MSFWDRKIETLPRKELEELQLKRLRDTVARCRRSIFYKNRLEDIDASQFTKVEDIHSLPFTTKKDLRNNYD